MISIICWMKILGLGILYAKQWMRIRNRGPAIIQKSVRKKFILREYYLQDLDLNQYTHETWIKWRKPGLRIRIPESDPERFVFIWIAGSGSRCYFNFEKYYWKHLKRFLSPTFLIIFLWEEHITLSFYSSGLSKTTHKSKMILNMYIQQNAAFWT
jgi:hypothetical protein